MRTYFREKQVHISSAVVYGLMRYIGQTGDTSILSGGGAAVIVECARFYLSLLLKRFNGEKWEIHDVIGPDEYHERVDNNAYTNRMAKFTFDAAGKAMSMLKDADPGTYAALDNQYGWGCIRKKFGEASEALYIPAPDQGGIIEQFDGYFDLEDASIEALRLRLLDPREYWGGAYGVASHTRVIKQADVAAMLWLFRDEYPRDILKKNWDYYEPRTGHGSSLSACMYALLACCMDEPGAGLSSFRHYLSDHRVFRHHPGDLSRPGGRGHHQARAGRVGRLRCVRDRGNVFGHRVLHGAGIHHPPDRTRGQV